MADSIDRSDKADAERLRWLLAGNGYFLEENYLCGHPPCCEIEQDVARSLIDAAMVEDELPDRPRELELHRPPS